MTQPISSSDSVLKNKKRGRKPKPKEDYRLDKEQTRFYIDLKNDQEAQKELIQILEFINKKDFGTPLGVKEVLIHSMNKLTKKDLEKIRDSSLTPIEKVERARVEFNEKHQTNYSMEEFLLRRLNLT